MIDLQVHRIRVAGWSPEAIKALAFDSKYKRLAIGRETGEVEVSIPCGLDSNLKYSSAVDL
jgi:hypothetical protein